MKTKKKKQIKKYLFTISLFIIFVLSFIDVKAQPKEVEPINYDFNNNVLLDKDGSYEPNMYNIRNQSEYNGNYLSEYSFETEILKTNTEIGFVDIVDSGNIVINDLFEGHSFILNMTSGTIFSHIIDDNMVFGSLELWIYQTDLAFAYFSLYDDNLEILIIQYHSNGDLIYQDYIDYKIITTAILNEWVHFKIDWYINGTFDFYQNTEKLVSDGYFRRNCSTGIDTIKFYTAIDMITYYDAIDFSIFSLYYKNRNLIPQKEYTNQYEVDKYEFDYNYESFEFNLYSWKQSEYNDTTNDVQIVVAGEQSINKYVDIWTPLINTESYHNGIGFHENLSSYIVNITYNFEVNILDTWTVTMIRIYPQNLTSEYPIAVKFNGQDGKIDIFNIDTLVYDEITSFSVDVEYELNIYLNYYDNIVIYKLTSLNQNFLRIYSLDDGNNWNNLYGLDNTTLYNEKGIAGNTCNVFVFSIGIYENGKYFQSSLDNREFGLMIYELETSWISINHNLITSNSINDYKLYVFNDCAKFLCGIKLRERNIQLEREIINIQKYSFDYDTPYLVFMLFDNFSIPYEVKIEGITLIRDDIESFGSYIYHNCNSDNNYFYVIDNELYYNFNNSLDSGIETMVIEFDVIDVLLDIDVLFTYTSYISSFYEGYVILETYGYFELFNISLSNIPIIKSYNLYNLTNIKKFTLTEIRIYIRTDILDNAIGITKGFVRNLNIWLEVPLLPDYDPIGILELDFLEAMIHVVVRLIIFMIPSLVFRYKFGNKSVIPMWFLMAIVLVISGFIPFWLFFVNVLAIGLMLITKKEGI